MRGCHCFWMAKFCSECGAQVPDAGKFCSECGSSLTSEGDSAEHGEKAPLNVGREANTSESGAPVPPAVAWWNARSRNAQAWIVLGLITVTAAAIGFLANANANA